MDIAARRAFERDARSERVADGEAEGGDPVARVARPVAHVVSTVKITAATRSGNQPPSAILVKFDAKKMLSTARNRPMVSVASTRFHFHTWKISTASISVVMIIVPLTEMP